MGVPPRSSVFDALAARLPFAVDDYPAAGRAFAAWRASGRDEDGDTVKTWAYCYVRRHLIGRFAHERTGSAADLDDAISRAFLDVLEAVDRVTEPERFPQYVSVICKRTVLGHRTRRQTMVAADDDVLPAEAFDMPAPYVSEAVRAALDAALQKLPPSVVEVARLRLVEQMSYEAIAEQLGRPIASVRTYAARACAGLRNDPYLRAHYFDDVLPPGAEGQGPVPT